MRTYIKPHLRKKGPYWYCTSIRGNTKVLGIGLTIEAAYKSWEAWKL